MILSGSRDNTLINKRLFDNKEKAFFTPHLLNTKLYQPAVK